MGLTQQHVGEALGMRFQQIQKYECAANRMSAAVLWKLAKILDVDVRYFFDGLSELGPQPGASLGNPRENERPAA